MGKFIVHIAEDNGHNVADIITTNYPNGKHYKINDNWYAVTSDKLTDDLSQELGFLFDDKNVENPAVGLVIRQEVISGYYSKAFWEWYKNE